MRALLIWLAAGSAVAPLERHPWTEAVEAVDGAYVVETNTFPEIATAMAAHLRRAHAFYEDRFGPLPEEGRRPMRVALFRTREEYLRFGEGVAGAVGHFDAALDRCALVWNGTLGETGWPVAVHEACHHYLRRRHPDARLPSWYSEGVACWFEGLLDPTTERNVARLRLRAAQAALAEGDARLDLLLAARAEVRTGRLVLDTGDADVPGLPPTRFYGLAWSLVHFLATDGRHRNAFRRFEMRLFAGRPPAGAEEPLARTLLAEECGDLAALERGWHEHLRGLPEPQAQPAAPAYAWEAESPNPYVRYAALRRLDGQPLPGDMRPGTLACLLDRDLVVRTAAARALAGTMGKDAVPGMIEALDLGDPELKEVAMRALAFAGAADAVPRLLGERDDRLGALRALAAIGDPRASHLLAAALEDPLLPAGLRARCAEALRKHAEATPLVSRPAAPRASAPAPPLEPRRLDGLLEVLADPSQPAAARRDACREIAAARASQAVPALKRLCRPHVEESVRLEAARALVALTGETRGFEPGQRASEREAAFRAWADE
jgi:hypothetical protein